VKIKIKIPATSANLGPGFDTLGMALSWKYEYTIMSTRKENQTDIKSKMVQKGFNSIFKKYGQKKIPNIKINTSKNILIGKGLGTSAACYLAGIEAANIFLQDPFNKEEKLKEAIAIEGHADNIMPAYYGGLQIIVKNENSNEISNLKIKVNNKIKLLVLVPSFSMPTKKTRKSIKKTVAIEDVVFNMSRSILLSHALESGKYHYLNEATKDMLHQKNRSQFFPEMFQVFDAGVSNGAHGVYLSGGGPTIGAFVTKNVEKIGQSMTNALNDANSIMKLCTIVNSGIQID
tara:strand:+ start:4659 stop:5525 length:867 start_codon:yes stop_codon:yes gene_type:complete